jgi:hypothetical protein
LRHQRGVLLQEVLKDLVFEVEAVDLGLHRLELRAHFVVVGLVTEVRGHL